MEHIFLNNVTEGTKFDGFYIVKSIAVKESSNGSSYLDLTVSDNSGTMDGKFWNLTRDMIEAWKDIEPGVICKIRGRIEKYKDERQIRIEKFRLDNKSDEGEYDLADLVKKAPVESEKMFAYIENCINKMGNEDIQKVCRKVLSDNRQKLEYYPAAMRIHHAEYGGLLYHMSRMLMMADAISRIYKQLDRDLMFGGVILHDIKKLDAMDSSEFGIVSGYTSEGQLLGHITLGTEYVNDVCRQLGINDETRQMLVHIVASHHGQKEYGSPVCPMFPEAEIVSYIDEIDTNLDIMDRVLTGLAPGAFSEPVWELDKRRVYKRL